MTHVFLGLAQRGKILAITKPTRPDQPTTYYYCNTDINIASREKSNHYLPLCHSESLLATSATPSKGNMSVKRLVCAIGVSVVVILGLYALNIARTSTSNLPNKENTALRIVSNEEYAPGMDISAANCPRTIPKTSTPGKPVWVAGYPGSGFDIVAPLSSAVSGLTAVDIYRQHTCLKPVQGTDIPISACMTHWPLVAKDSPAQVAMNDGILYQHQAVFLIRNPAQAIPSYHTRWWGAQKHIRANHETRRGRVVDLARPAL